MKKVDPENDFIIRNYSDSDYNKIIEFWDITDMGSPERGDNKQTIERTIVLGGTLLIMEVKSTHELCGTSWMTVDGRRVLLHHFGILPEYQGLGLSKILLKESFKFVKSKGLQVKLEVHAANNKAINLYKKFGFDHLGEYKIYIIRDLSKIEI